MYHVLLEDVNFWLFLLLIDKDLATSARRSGCPCGGRLHCANYLRNPARWTGSSRQGVLLPAELLLRPRRLPQEGDAAIHAVPRPEGLSGCRDPLGGGQSAGAFTAAMRELSKLFGADRRTIARWQVLWCEHFPHSRFWKVARAAFVPAIEEAALPRSLLEAFLRTDDPREDWKRLLCFLSPITIAEGLAVEVPR